MDTGVLQSELDQILADLSLPPSDQAAVFAVRDTDRVVTYASDAVLTLFGASTPQALHGSLVKGTDAGAARISAITGAMPLAGGPRLERLPFTIGGKLQTLTVLCRRIEREAGAHLIAVVLNPPRIVAPPKQPDPPKKGEDAPPRASTADRSAGKNVRFLWSSDAAGQLRSLGKDLSAITGPSAEALVGRDLLEGMGALDPSGRLNRLLAGQASWSGIALQWPIDGTAATAPVTLGALPAFDKDGGFDGFRGFGLVLKSEALPAPVELPAAVAAPKEEIQSAAEAANIVPLRLGARSLMLVEREPDAAKRLELTRKEKAAFSDIARALATNAGPQQPEDAAREAAPPTVPDLPDAVAADAVQAKEFSDGAADETADFRTLLDRVAVGLAVSHEDRLLFLNRFARDLLGYSDAAAFEASGGLSTIFVRHPTSDNETLALRTRSGDMIAANVRLQSIDWEGHPATLFTIQRSEESAVRAKLEGELSQLESEVRELNAILDTAMDGIAVIDVQGRLLNLNRSGEALFGVDQADLVGQPFTMLLAVEEHDKAIDYFEGVKSDGVASLLNDGREMTGRARQGGAIPLFMTLGRIGAGEGADGKFCALLRDLTHWKKVEQELQTARADAERVSALKSDFLAKVSHEVRTPLNAILGFAEVIIDERFGPLGNERYKDYLKDIHSSGAHVMSLVNDLLDLSKIEAGKMDLAFTSVDANKVIAECVSLMQPQAARERVIMRLSLAARLPPIFADERSLRQIVLNLLSNAVKFNEPGGQVIVASQLTEAGHAVIRVRDTGIGMSDADIELALEPFRQVATSRASSGTGLGLPLTKALVEANQAYFSIKSRKNEGTLIEITFPPARVLAD